MTQSSERQLSRNVENVCRHTGRRRRRCWRRLGRVQVVGLAVFGLSRLRPVGDAGHPCPGRVRRQHPQPAPLSAQTGADNFLMTFNSTELASNSIVAICSNQFDLNSAIGSPPSGLAELGNDNPMQRLCPEAGLLKT